MRDGFHGAKRRRLECRLLCPLAMAGPVHAGRFRGGLSEARHHRAGAVVAGLSIRARHRCCAIHPHDRAPAGVRVVVWVMRRRDADGPACGGLPSAA